MDHATIVHPRGTMIGRGKDHGRAGNSTHDEVHQDRLRGGDRAVVSRGHRSESVQRLTAAEPAFLGDTGSLRDAVALARVTPLGPAIYQDDDGGRQAAL